MIFGKYLHKTPKQKIQHVHHCSPPFAYDQGEGTLWKCRKCQQIWRYTGKFPYTKAIPQ